MQVYEQQPLARMKLLAEVLATLSVAPGGKLATLTITNAMKQRCGATHSLTDGFINHARSIDGVEVAASFTEPEPAPGAAASAPADGAPPEWKVSFRSRGNVDVAAIAQKFGGGGHKNAAGCALRGSEEELRALLAAEESSARWPVEAAPVLSFPMQHESDGLKNRWLRSSTGPEWSSSTSPRARRRSMSCAG